MEPKSSTTVFFFVIDTDQYSGNFEREMCAYLTGQYGDCEVGKPVAKEFERAHPEQHKAFSNVVIPYFDNDGCQRPTEIYPTPGRFNTGMGLHFDDDADLATVKQAHIEAVDAYWQPKLEYAEKQVRDGNLEWARDAKTAKLRISEARTLPLQRYSAFESVAIAFEESPTPEQIQFMKKRAVQYATDTDFPLQIRFRPLKIKGFRLVTHTDVVYEVSQDV